MKKTAVLSMDIEDWYHGFFFDREKCDREYHMLDGLDRYIEILEKAEVPSSFFCVTEIAEKIGPRLKEMAGKWGEVGVHTSSHGKPLEMTLGAFEEDVRRGKQILEQVTSMPVEGFRAPSFNMDRARLDVLPELGYTYDSSKISFALNSDYGSIDMDGFDVLLPRSIYRRGDFFEFEVGTYRFLNRTIPIAGGYIRLFPWPVIKRLLSAYQKQNELYLFYIHPYELSRRPLPKAPAGSRWSSDFLFRYGQKSTYGKILKIIDFLRESGFEFTTFAKLRKEMMA